jgi:hypothetical protein
MFILDTIFMTLSKDHLKLRNLIRTRGFFSGSIMGFDDEKKTLLKDHLDIMKNKFEELVKENDELLKRNKFLSNNEISGSLDD